MHNILVFSHGMEIGGAESALLGLLMSFDYSEYNVDLFLMHHSGELMKYIPRQVNILPEDRRYSSLSVPFSTVLKKRAFGVALGRLAGKKKAARYAEQHKTADDAYVFIDYSHKYTQKYMPMISDKEYDLAISFLTPHYFVSSKVRAKKKIAWIHTDYSSIEVDVESELPMWGAYDSIIAISDEVGKSFLKVFPSLKDKIQVVANIHPSSFIRKRACEFTVEDEMPDDGFVKLLSVGRYCHAKNFDNVPEICSQLENVKWYIIGYGGDENLIKQKINEFNMQDRVILLGKKENPYPYFKACDFYVQPSRYEGNSVTVNEALILGKLTAIANYSTASGQIDNGVNGIIFPQDNDGCAQALSDFIGNKELQMKIFSNIKSSDFSKSEEVKKIYRIIG